MKISEFFENEKGFPKKEKANKASCPRSRKYDVQITLNKSGNKSKNVVRVGLYNDLAYMKMYDYATCRFTDEKLTIVFTNEKPSNARVFKLQCNTKAAMKDPSTAIYFAFTPSEEAEKVIRTKWVGKGFPAHYAAGYDLEGAMIYESLFNEGVTNK